MLQVNNASKSPLARQGQGAGEVQQRNANGTTTGIPRPYLDQLPFIPEDWRLVPVGGKKAPIEWNGAPAQTGWAQRNAVSASEFLDRVEGKAPPPAAGVILGEATGVISVDLDEPGKDGERDASFKAITGHDVADLPPTVTSTSGREGRRTGYFTVPDANWWPYLRNRPHLSKHKDPETGKGVTLWELRVNGMAVILGAHPKTQGYSWVPGCSPQDVQVAEAPEWLLEAMVIKEEEIVPRREPAAEDAARAVEALAFIPAEEFQGYEPWLSIGMALHAADPDLLDAWIDWSRGMRNFDEDECRRKWKNFGRSAPFKGRPITVGTLFFHAKKHGYRGVKKPPSAEAVLEAVEAVEIKDGVVDAEALKKVFLLAGERLSLTGEDAEVIAIVQLLKQKGVAIGDSRRGIAGGKTAAKQRFNEQKRAWLEQGRSASSDPYLVTEKPVDMQAAEVLVITADGRVARRAGYAHKYDPDKGFWFPWREDDIKHEAQVILKQMYRETDKGILMPFGSAHQVESAMRSLYHQIAPGVLGWVAPPPVIVFDNGTLDLRTGKFGEHSPDHGATYALNASYIPGSSCPAELMRVILVCYGPGAVIIRALIRWVVDPTIPYGKCFHLMGPTGRGKGTVIAFLLSLLDRRITSSLTSPAVLTNTDKLHQFAVGKRLIVYPDVKVDSCRSADLSLFFENVENAPQTPRKLFVSQAEETCPLFNRSIIGSVGPLQFPRRQGFDRRTLCLQTTDGDGSRGAEDPSLKGDLLESERAPDIRSEAVSWAMEMPLDEVLQVLDRNDPEGLLWDGHDASRFTSDYVSKFIDQCLIPHPMGHRAEVTDLDWHRIFTAYRAWAKDMQGLDHKLQLPNFQGQVREALPNCHRKRGKESLEEMIAGGRTRSTRLNTSALDHGFQLRTGILAGGTNPTPGDFDPSFVRRDGLELLKEQPPWNEVARPADEG